MNNKTRNTEARRIYRPLTLGQVRDDVEAFAVAVVDIFMKVDLLPPFPQSKLWRA